jgi:hypothetical protein
VRQGRCRYVMPWNPCRNQEGNEHYSEAVENERIAELIFEAEVKNTLCAHPDHMSAVQWAHDNAGMSWRFIYENHINWERAV